MSWNTHAFDYYLSSAPTPPQKPRLEHNFGIASTNDGIALCHTLWEGETLAIVDWWSEDFPSNDMIVSQVVKTINSWDSSHRHQIDLFSGNQAVQNMIVSKLYRQVGHTIKWHDPAVRPSDASSYLTGLLNDGKISVGNEQRESVGNAFLDISQNELGQAVGSPESLALLYGVAEPFNRRFTPDESERKGRELYDQISALVD